MTATDTPRSRDTSGANRHHQPALYPQPMPSAVGWAERVLAAFDASATGVVQIDGVMLECAAPRAGAPHHDVIRTPLISDCVERSTGRGCYRKATHGEDCAIVLYVFSRVDDGHSSWAVSWRGVEITALRGEGEPTCQPTSNTTQLRTLRFSAPAAWDFCRCSSETSSPIGAWQRSTSSMSAPTAAAKSGRP